jgi:hypothetical protein
MKFKLVKISHIEFLQKKMEWFMCYIEKAIYGELIIMGQYNCKCELPNNLPYQISIKSVTVFML